MHTVLEVTSLLEFYKAFGPALLEHGQAVRPRGQETKELLGATFCITDPTQRLAYFPSRRFNLPFALVESLMLFQSSNKVKYFSHFNANVAQFSDDLDTFYGSYGARIASEIPRIIDKLGRDRDTRQAVLTIHRLEDTFAETKDVPCTICLQFMIREDALNLHVTMRSNDIIWGIPYDVFNFTMLQEIVANTLGIAVGKYYHTANSLHIYSHHYDLLEKMLLEAEQGYAKSEHFASSELEFHLWKAKGRAYMFMVDESDRQIAEKIRIPKSFIEWVKQC